MGKEEFKHFFDAGRLWALKHVSAGEGLRELREVAMVDVIKRPVTAGVSEEGFAAGAIYEITLAEFTR